MKLLLTTSLMFLAINANAAAKIFAKDAEGKYVIELDNKGVPRTNKDSKTYPTIKDFRQNAESVFCINGSDSAIRKLLLELVAAADGDGDSYAQVKGIYKNPRSWAVLAEITDESGRHVERFSFANCK